jgi:hypothetical protein
MYKFQRFERPRPIDAGLFPWPCKVARFDWDRYTTISPYRHMPCLYFIQVLDPRWPEHPLEIHRMGKVDRFGIAEIGQTLNLEDRMSHFKVSAENTSNSSSEGWLYGLIFRMNEWFNRLFGTIENLLDHTQFLYVKTRPKDLRGRENIAIDKYVAKYWEAPITNGQVPGVNKRPDDYKVPVKRPSFDTGPKRARFPPGIVSLAHPPPNYLDGISGIYKIHWLLRSDHNRFRKLNRLASPDLVGIMEIGKSKDIGVRLRGIRSDFYGRQGCGEWRGFYHAHDISPSLRKAHGSMLDILEDIGVSYREVDPSQLRTEEEDRKSVV